MTDRESHYKETLFNTKEQPVATTKQLYPMTGAQKEFMSKPTQYGKLPPTKPEEREVLYADATGTYKLVRKSSSSCMVCACDDRVNLCPTDSTGALLCTNYSAHPLRVFEKLND